MGGQGMKSASLSQLGGGGLAPCFIYQKDLATGNYRLFDYSFGGEVPQKVEPKPEKKNNFAEAMIGNIKRKFREDL